MGDMKEFYEALRKYSKERHIKNNALYKDKLVAAGAEFKTDGVYRLGDFDCYPGRGYARNYRTNSHASIELVIEHNGDAGKIPEPKLKGKITLKDLELYNK